MREISVKPRINKRNKQINISIPRKKLSLDELDKISSGKSIKLLFEANE